MINSRLQEYIDSLLDYYLSVIFRNTDKYFLLGRRHIGMSNPLKS